MAISRVVIPPAATSFSALGLLTAELDYTVSQSERVRIPDLDHIDDDTVQEINEIITSLDDQAADAFTDVDEKDLEMARYAFVGYRNQSLEVEVPLPDPPLDAADISSVIDQFMQRFNRIYGEGSAHKQGGVVFKTFQSEAIVQDISHPSFDTGVEALETSGEDAYRTTREAFDRQSGMLVDMDVYEGTELDPGTAITGPSILEYPGTTVVLHASDRAKVDALGGIEITVMEGDQ
jgi:N-methylhydantoinase A